MNRGNVFKIGQDIIRDARENPVHFGTGLLNEHIYASAYSRLSIDDLKKVSYIIGKIIKLKKEKERQKLNAGNLDKLVRSSVADSDEKLPE